MWRKRDGERLEEGGNDVISKGFRFQAFHNLKQCHPKAPITVEYLAFITTNISDDAINDEDVSGECGHDQSKFEDSDLAFVSIKELKKVEQVQSSSTQHSCSEYLPEKAEKRCSLPCTPRLAHSQAQYFTAYGSTNLQTIALSSAEASTQLIVMSSL